MFFLRKNFWLSIFIALVLLTLILSVILSDHSEAFEHFYLDANVKDYNSYHLPPLKGKKLYTDNYERKDIVNSKNIKMKSRYLPERYFLDSRMRVEPLSFFDRFLNLLWSINYSPGPLSRGHSGFKNNCLACHSLFNTDYSENCLDCHIAQKEKMQAEHGFHYNKQQENCISCHVEHSGESLNYVDLSVFRHTYTEYKLVGYHKKADCYYCHLKARPVKPNTIVSQNTIAREFLRFSIDQFGKCLNCHPDPHKPTFGWNCQECHPLTMRWWQ